MNLNNFKWIEVDISLLLLFGIANTSSNAISNLTIVCVAKCCFELRTLLTMLIRSLTDNPKRISMRKQKLEKTRAKTRNIPNEKKTESLTTKARIRRKERERQWKKEKCKWSRAHVFRPIEYGNDRIQRVFLWHTLKTFELLAALYQFNSSKKQKQNNKQNTRCLWQTCDIPSNAQRPLSILL